MKWYKKVLIGLAAVIMLAIIANIGMNYWITNELPRIINERNNTPYMITYKDLKVSLFDRSINARNIIVIPKTAAKDQSQKNGIYAKIHAVSIDGFHIWDILFSDKIVAKTLTIEKPEVTLLKKTGKALENRKSIRTDIVEPFSKIIFVSDIVLDNGSIRIAQSNGHTAILSVSNLSLRMEGILISEETLKGKLPFICEKYSVECDSLYYRTNEFYHLEALRFKTTEKNVKVAAFKMVPEYSRAEFVQKVPKEKDLYNIQGDSISINNMRWGFKNDEFFFNTRSIVLHGINADIYRSKVLPDDMKKKKLYNRLLREISFEMKVDTLLLKNSKIAYEETNDYSRGPGILTFNQFNMTVTGISSGFNKKKLPDVKIDVRCLFMNSAKLKVNWSFNVLDQSDGFNIKGNILNFPAEKLAPFTKPYINAEIKGDLDEVYFNFTGNDKRSAGDFAINYDDMKVKVFQKKNPKKKHKLLTTIANIFVKNDTKGKINNKENTEVEVDRIPEKSFYNLLWRSLAEGLKKTLL